MTTITVTNSVQLVAALKAATAGENILLATGTYNPFTLYGFKVPAGVTISSATPSAPAILTGFTINNSSGLTFNNVTFSAANTPVGKNGAEVTVPFNFNNDVNISMNNDIVSGNPLRTLTTQVSGLNFEICTNVNVTNCAFSYLHNAINQTFNNGLNISNNTFANIMDDCIRGGGTSNVTIEDNQITDDHANAADTDHPDCIQFWTLNTKTSASNIIISGNNYTMGNGSPVQGIWMFDNYGNLPFKAVTITNNSFIGTDPRGISVSDGFAIVIKANTVTAYQGNFLSGIVLQTGNDITVANNAANYYNFQNITNLASFNNSVIKEAPPAVIGPLTDPAAPLQPAGMSDIQAMGLGYQLTDGFTLPSGLGATLVAATPTAYVSQTAQLVSAMAAMGAGVGAGVMTSIAAMNRPDPTLLAPHGAEIA